QTQVSNDVVLN
nr:BX {N-terminal} [Streptococcus pyogenes, 27297 (T12, B3264; genotype ETA-, ETB+, ETC-), isolate from scarlet fever patient, Peptide Partial, 11 aa] [Streptococcus pyogenes]